MNHSSHIDTKCCLEIGYLHICKFFVEHFSANGIKGGYDEKDLNFY
jgi:hypothetical protein